MLQLKLKGSEADHLDVFSKQDNCMHLEMSDQTGHELFFAFRCGDVFTILDFCGGGII